MPNDYNNNFKVDLSEDKPVLQLDLQLKPMSEAPKDGSAVLCLVRHDDTKTFDADHGGLTPYGAWLEGSARVPDGICLLSYCGGYSETDRESGITEHMPNWWFDTAERVGYPVGWYAVIDAKRKDIKVREAEAMRQQLRNKLQEALAAKENDFSGKSAEELRAMLQDVEGSVERD